MPNLDGGDIDAARAKAKANVAALLPFALEGKAVVACGPTCSYTMKKEWPELLGTPEARRVAAATFEFSVHPDRCGDVALKALLMAMTEVERRCAYLRQ